MQILTSETDVRRLIVGAAVAAVSGLLIGAVAHPNLRGEREAEGPQMLTPGGGIRTAAYAADPGVGVYGGQVPEYVMGTDWTRPREVATYQLASADDANTYADTDDTAFAPALQDDAGRATATPAAWRDERRHPSYDRDGDERFTDSERWVRRDGDQEDEAPLADDAG